MKVCRHPRGWKEVEGVGVGIDTYAAMGAAEKNNDPVYGSYNRYAARCAAGKIPPTHEHGGPKYAAMCAAWKPW